MTAASVDPEALLALAMTTAREAGALLLRLQSVARSDVLTKSSRTDMVSDADRASEQLIAERIRAERPDDAILGEEGMAGEPDGVSGVRWVIDPLDGTTNYLYWHPAFVVSIGVEVDGATVAGAVYAPVYGEMFSARIGGGARLNGERIATSGLDELATALVGTGFGYDAERRAAQGLMVARVLPVVRDIRRGGAAALDLCWVACGRLDAYYEHGLQAWDMCAGDLIVREAGGVTSAIEGGQARPGSMLASTAALHEPLRAVLLDG